MSKRTETSSELTRFGMSRFRATSQLSICLLSAFLPGIPGRKSVAAAKCSYSVTPAGPLQRSGLYRRSAALLRHKADNRATFRQAARLPKWWATRRLRNLPSQCNRYSRQRGTILLFHGKSSPDRRSSRAGNCRAQLHGNEGGRQSERRFGRPSEPSQDTATLHGRLPRRM